MSVGLVNSAKELARTYQPLLLAEFVFTDGTVLRCATHGLRTSDGGFQYAGNDYLPRILNQDIAALQILSEQGIALPPSVSIQLNDGDKYIWTNYEKAKGFKGAKLTLRFVFWNVDANDFSSDYLTPFVGFCSAPSLDETTLTVRAVSLLNMEQTLLPTIRVQKTCPWIFPETAAQRQEGADSPDSFYYECGYSPDASGGNARGNLNGGVPYTKCNHTKADCQARGMFEKDSALRMTGRFGGVQWDPPQSFRSRGYLTGKWEEGFNTSNEAKYGDFVPFVYGTAWVDPIICNVVGDANYTAFEALICFGEVDDILRVIVNDVEVPAASTMTHGSLPVKDVLFHWNLVNRGHRDGGPAQGNIYEGKGDPYGSFCTILITVPRKLADSSSVPRVRVLVRGPRIRQYKQIASISVSGGVATVTFVGPDDSIASNDPNYRVTISGCSLAGINGTWGPVTNWTYGPPGTIQFSVGLPDGSGTGGMLAYKEPSVNPVWILMEVLVWAGWTYADLDLQSFADAERICNTAISYKDQFGATVTHERYRASMVLRQRRSAAEIVRGLCTAMNAVLVPNQAGALQIVIKQTIASQQPTPVAGSNHNTPVASKLVDGTPANGYVAYRFDPSNIVRRNGQAQVSVTQRSNQDTPNRVSFTFQDEDNNYAFDSVNVVDAEAMERAGQEVSGNIPVEGITNYDQARRIVATWQAEAYRGNPRNFPYGDAGGTLQFEVETTFKVVHLKIGHICLLTFPLLGLSDQPVRVVKIQPSTNFETTRVTLQWHSDEWYVDTWGQEDAPRYSAQRRNRVARPPYPILATRQQTLVNPDPLWEDERPAYSLLSAKNFEAQLSSQYFFRLTGFLPVNTFSAKIRPPFAPIQGTTSPIGGQLPGGRNYWVALVAFDSDDKATPHSNLVNTFVPAGTNTNTITVSGIDWDDDTVGYAVFVGEDPYRLYNYTDKINGKPSSITVNWGLVSEHSEPIPDTEFDVLRVKTKQLPHAGVFGALVTATTSDTITCDGAGWTENEWAGRVVSFVGLFFGSGVDMPPGYNFLVLSNTSDTLTIDTSYGPPPNEVSPTAGDLAVMVMRARATTYSATTIGDAKFDNSLALKPAKPVEDATNTSPIVVKVTDHSYQTGDRVKLAGVGGNTATNGIHTITKVDDAHFSLNETTGNGTYVPGTGAVGLLTGGLAVDAEVGRFVRIIAGTGKGQWKRVKENTATVLTIEGQWEVTPDDTSIFWIEDAAWDREQDIAVGDIATFSPSVVPEYLLDVRGLERQVCMIMPVGVDGGGNETFESAAQAAIRDFYLFKDTAFTSGAYRSTVTLTVEGALAIGSDLAPRLSIAEDVRAQGVKIEVKQAPTGAALTVDLYVGGALWMTLSIPAGSTSATATQAQIDAAPTIHGGDNIRLDITGVGTTSPGSDLSAFIYL
jgi:hypothetical protein